MMPMTLRVFVSLSVCVCACVHAEMCLPAPMVEASHWLRVSEAKPLSLLAGSSPWGLPLPCRVQRSCQLSLSGTVAKKHVLGMTSAYQSSSFELSN